jgi:hypothetical protein
MTVSGERRRKDTQAALRMMAGEVGDDDSLYQISWSEDEPQFADLIPTTWDELEERFLIKNQGTLNGPRRYCLTPAGWVEGLQEAGVFNSPEFRARCIDLVKYFKRHVAGRRAPALISREALRSDGLPFGWVLNVLRSRLLHEMFPERRMNAEWDEWSNIIRVPVTFGMPD